MPAYKLWHDEPASALRAEAKKIGDPEFEAKPEGISHKV